MTMAEDDISVNRFMKFMAVSALCHVLFVLLPIVFNYFGIFSSQDKRVTIKVIQPAVRVDIVAMPKQTLQELKELTELGSVNIAPKEEIESPTVSEQENLFDFLKEVSKQKVKKIENRKNKDQGNKKSSLSKQLSKDLKNIILAGNKLSDGVALYGDNTNDNEVPVEFRNYLSRLPDIVRKFWKLPSYLKETEYRCRIRLFLNPGGSLIKAEIFESSGNREFDERALGSVYNSAPFPPLPKGAEKMGSSGNIVLGFPL